MTNAERSPTFYRFDPQEQLELYQQLDAADEEVVVVYHSHTSTEAYPTDRHLLRRRAAGPLRPGVVAERADRDGPASSVRSASWTGW